MRVILLNEVLSCGDEHKAIIIAVDKIVSYGDGWVQTVAEIYHVAERLFEITQAIMQSSK